MASKKRAALFSRDERTFGLFRKSWLIALERSDFQVRVYNRGFGYLRLLKSSIDFICAKESLRLIFGTSEICLYYIFSKKDDILVFTGLGRLLQKDGLRKRFVCTYLKIFYKEQKIVALNSDDVLLLSMIFSSEIFLIEGEGFHFRDIQVKRGLGYPLVIAYAGRMLRSKGVEKLIEQFLLIKSDQCHLHLFGDFDFSSSDSISTDWLYKKLFEAKGRIRYHGFIKDIKKIMASIDIFVSLSEREGLPFSVLEAIDAGCYVVLSAVPGHLSFSSLDGVEIISANKIANTLNTLISDPKRITSFDQDQRIIACQQRFGTESVVNQIKFKLLA
jgi:glycosyltransferase involved in cell wall biosynthesis